MKNQININWGLTFITTIKMLAIIVITDVIFLVYLFFIQETSLQDSIVINLLIYSILQLIFSFFLKNKNSCKEYYIALILTAIPIILFSAIRLTTDKYSLYYIFAAQIYIDEIITTSSVWNGNIILSIVISLFVALYSQVLIWIGSYLDEKRRCAISYFD